MESNHDPVLGPLFSLAPSALTPEAEHAGRLHNTGADRNGVKAGFGSAGIRKSELPWHRNAALMYATGVSKAEIRAQFDVSKKCVDDLLATPWFQQRVSEYQKEHARDIMDLFKAEAVNSFHVLVQLRDDPKTSANVRAGICNTMHDRVLGKPTQRVETVHEVTSDDPAEEAKRLKAAIERDQRSMAGFGDS